MQLSRHQTGFSARWAVDDFYLPHSFRLGLLLELPAGMLPGILRSLVTKEKADDPLLPPVEPEQEIWASGVTYLRSRDARVAELQTADIYGKVYQAERPELFFKATGMRCAGHGQPVRVRPDSAWNVPEPELVLVINRAGEIVGYTAGNDVSSRSIEAENPLYLPQAKIYNGSTALGSRILLCDPASLADIKIEMEIYREGELLFEGETSTRKMKRAFSDLVQYLYRELAFPQGAFLFTGTGLVPPDDFTLQIGDLVQIRVGEVVLENSVVK